MHFTLLTLFPDMFPGPLGETLAGTALEKRLWSYNTLNLRDFGRTRHQNVDDTPFGGGPGMIMRPDVLDPAIRQAKASHPDAPVLYMSARGKKLDQNAIIRLANQTDIIILCGRFEGVDQRVLDAHNVEEVSLGDYVLSGGELAAMVLMDACIRLIPGVIGEPETLQEESFGLNPAFRHLLEYPQYTRPAEWEGRDVPEVLQSGHHERIREWRLKQAEQLTRERRPDLWKEYERLKSKEKE